MTKAVSYENEKNEFMHKIEHHYRILLLIKFAKQVQDIKMKQTTKIKCLDMHVFW